MQTQEQRITALEKANAELQGKITAIQQIAGLDTEWVTTHSAAKLIGVSPTVIRRRIREAQASPRTCPYKKGVHWRGDTRFQVNWQKRKDQLSKV